MPLKQFHPIVSTWFSETFEKPTQAQAKGWPAIARGRDTLIAAPTGSGKTLAAFLACLDALVRKALAGELDDRIQVVYLSPLKALGNDIEKNLQAPLTGLRAVAERLGYDLPAIRTFVRSGDTSQSARQRMARRPPHILITTPESLYILLTARIGRQSLATTHTVIVDEIHAVAGSKRGSHMALSLERLDALVAAEGSARPVRIGLSATQKPIETIARMLVGGGRELPLIVDSGHERPLDLHIELPAGDELGPIAAQEQMAEVYDRVAELVKAHRTTLVFVNTRRMAERFAHALGERLGEDQVRAHHGALARKRRLDAEQKLKAAEVPVVVATASLELGIDVGDVELVVQFGSPRSIATFLQRVGRSGHSLGATPKGRLFATTRDQLIECAALIRSVRRGELDRICVPPMPLDILSQQLVAMCACDDWDIEALFALVRQAAPYAELPRKDFDQVLEMLSEGIATERGRSRAHLHMDRVNGQVKGRRGARMAAITSGGAIPDRADYKVVAEPDNMRVGTIDEDFAIESLAGDVFLLGSTAWRVRRVESRAGVVRVEDAQGANPNVPFWFGEAPARTAELSSAVGDLRQDVFARLQAGDSLNSVSAYIAEQCKLPAAGAEQLVAYLAASSAMLGAMPTQRCIVAERFFDEGGGMQLVIHAPLGARINRAWGLALRKRFCVSFNFELQAAATDDGIVISLGPHHSFPLEAVFEFLRPQTVGPVLTQALLTGSPMWGARWRWNATRSLAVLRFTHGKRTPYPLQRIRCDDLLAAVFPDQAACQENITGALEPPDHPLVKETLRDCLQEWMDLDGLRQVLADLESGAMRAVAIDSPEPSPLSHELLNANPYAFLDDAPLEERRSRAVTLRRGLPSLADDLGVLDPQAIAQVVADMQPVVRDPDELHDALLTLHMMPVEDPLAAPDWVTTLVGTQRIVRATWGADGAAWVASERVELVRTALPEAVFQPTPPVLDGGLRFEDSAAALKAIVRGHMEISGPVESAVLAGRLGLPRSDVDHAIHAMESDGLVLRGRFTGRGKGDALDGETVEWCDRRVLARIHRLTISTLRKQIQPVSAADLLRFLFRWQHLMPNTRLSGADGLAIVLEQLQGFELASAAWEKDVLPARLTHYDQTWLDDLCYGGELAWGRLKPREVGSGAAPSRAAPVTFALREDLPWLLVTDVDLEALEASLSHAARDVLACLRQRGALFTRELESLVHRLPCEVEDGLWELVAAGFVTADGFGALRSLLRRGRTQERKASAARRDRRYRGQRPRLGRGGGRWSLLRPQVSLEEADEAPPAAEPDVEAVARQLLRRYGIVFRDLLARENTLPPWRDLLRVYRRLEARGELRGGRFVTGFVGEQFALPDAVAAMRAVRRRHDEPEIVRVPATDPLNLAGILTPGPRVPAVLGNAVIFRDGVPVASKEAGQLVERPILEDPDVAPDRPRLIASLLD